MINVSYYGIYANFNKDFYAKLKDYIDNPFNILYYGIDLLNTASFYD